GGQPDVVVVAEGDQVAGGRVEAAVPATGQALPVGVRDEPDAATGPGRQVEGADADVVVDHDALDLAGVVLGQDAGHRPFQQPRAVPRGDDDTDRGVRHRGRR